MLGRTPKRRVPRPARRTQAARRNSFLRQVARRLPEVSDNPHGNHNDPLDELVFIILSAQTESYLYRRTFQDLKNAYTPWNRLLDASDGEVASIIRRGGLARKKTTQLKAAFRQILADRGRLSLSFLGRFSDEDAYNYLISLSGVGVKTAKCVMMYALRRPAFPVDTHVWRIARRLGIAPPTPKPSDAQERELESRIPKALRFDLHVNFVSLGKETCHTYFPKCDSCALSDLCPTSGKTDVVWAQWRQPRGVWAKAISKEAVNQDPAA
jgi:endonuclease-3